MLVDDITRRLEQFGWTFNAESMAFEKQADGAPVAERDVLAALPDISQGLLKGYQMLMRDRLYPSDDIEDGE